MAEVVIPAGRIPDGFARSVAAYLRKTADQGVATLGGVKARDAAAILRTTAEYVESLTADDQRVLALYETQVYGVRPPGGDRNAYVPGREQGTVITNAGLTNARPSASELLAEVVAAAVRDLYKAIGSRMQEQADHSKREAEERARARHEPRLLAAQDAEAAAKESQAAAESKLLEVAAERDYLRSHLDAIEGAKAELESEKPTRRKKAAA
jgi:hypothetical protein